jgi:photosystem II stability/assembly factor-like uncharacterized protein
MKKTNLIIAFLLLGNSIFFSQFVPQNYEINPDKFFKVTDKTPLSNSITDIITDGNIVWLGTSRGLSKTEDDGITWMNYFNAPDFSDESIIALGESNGIIWATLGHSREINGSLLPEGSGLVYSTDNGTTWVKIPQPVDEPGDSLISYGANVIRALPVTTAVNNISYDIAFTKNTVWIASFAGGLRKSSDFGKTWQRVILPPDNLDSISPEDTLHFSLQPVAGKFGPENYLNHRVFSVIGIDDSTLIVGTAGGINKSTDNGISWQKFNHQNQTQPITGNFITALAYDKAKNVIWASTWKAEAVEETWGVSSSANGGKSWETYLLNERAHNFGFKYFGDYNSPYNSEVIVATDNGIFRSNDNGKSWLSPGTIYDKENSFSIETNIFYSVASKKLYENSVDIWIGSSNGLAVINETFGLWEGTWRVFLASPEISNKGKTFAFPNPFSPYQRSVKIKYNLHGSIENVSIRIFDFNMNLVRTLIQNAQRGGQDQIEYWNGKDDNGKYVSNGVYFYRVDIGEKEILYGKILVIK